MGKLILICEDTLEGFFSAIYTGWTIKKEEAAVEIKVSEGDNLELFTQYKKIKTNQEQANKVIKTIKDKLGVSIYEKVCFTLSSNHPDKGTAVFWMLKKAYKGRKWNHRITEQLADPYINLVQQLQIKVWHEYHRFLGFVRFQEINGILFSKIAPENNILEYLDHHFANRFPNEHWIIYDISRKKALVHRKGERSQIYQNMELSEESEKLYLQGEQYEELWRIFCDHITIEERKNLKLQQQFLPLKFRNNMTEFQDRQHTDS